MRARSWSRGVVAGSAALAVAVVIGVPVLAGRLTADAGAHSTPLSHAAIATAPTTVPTTAAPSPSLSATPVSSPTGPAKPDPRTGSPDPSRPVEAKPSMSTAPGIVPWSPTVYDEKAPTLIPDTVPEPGLLPCKQADVLLTFARFQGGLTAGGISGMLTVTGKSGHRCVLQGWPTITFRGSDGRPIATALLHQPFMLPYAITMDSTQVANSMIQLRGNTSADKIATADASLPGWTSPVVLDYRGEQPHYNDAGPGTGAFALAWMFSPLNGDELSYSGLRGLIMIPTDFPAEVKPGGELLYQLNVMPALGDVALAPCIGFRESLRDSETDALVATEDHVLNCEGVGTIAKNTTVRFAMRMRVPTSAIPGRQLILYWQTVTGQDDGGSAPGIAVR